MIAEESTTWPKVTEPVTEGGLGFNYKWNLGWMHDTLRFFRRDQDEKPSHYKDLTFGMLYHHKEHFLLPLSHDEVVHEKGSLFQKMGEEPFAALRLLYTYLFTYPGKKLLFMGGEFGQKKEWDCKKSLSWELLKEPFHQQLHQFVEKLNHFYLKSPPLWEGDFKEKGFEWVSHSDPNHPVVGFLRRGGGRTLFALFHFGKEPLIDYPIDLQKVILMKEVFSTAKEKGCAFTLHPFEIVIDIPPFSARIFDVQFDEN